MSSGANHRGEKPGEQKSEVNQGLHTHGGQQDAVPEPPSRNPAAIIDDEQLARMVSAMLIAQGIADDHARSSRHPSTNKGTKSCSLPGPSTTAHRNHKPTPEPVSGNATDHINNDQQAKILSAMLNSPIIADKQPRPPSRPADAADTEAASHHSRTTSTAHRIQGMIDRMLRDTAAIGRQLERDSRELSRMSKLLAARSKQLEDCQSGIEDIIRPVVRGSTARDELESFVRAMDEWTRKNDQDRAANRIQDGLATEMSGKLGELELALHDSLWGQSESVASSVGLLDEMKNMRVIGAPDLFPLAAVSSDEQDSCGESAVVETAQVESYTKATGKVKKVVSFKADQCPETGKATAGIPDGVGTSSPNTETSGKHKGRGKRRGGKRARRNKAGRNAKR